MHLVMLQAMLAAPFEIVPILVGDADPHEVAEALRVVWGGPETVIAVSSDLSHFLDREKRRSRSTPTPPGGSRRSTRHRSKGAGPAASCPSRARSKSPPSATCGQPASIWRLRPTPAPTRRGSSATAPSRSNIPPRRGSPKPIESSCFRPAWPRSERRRGTAASRRRSSLNRKPAALSPWRATFVTLTENERLRGCIGSPAPRRPLIDDAIANTAKAGFADPRFAPLKESDLAGLRLDVSILSHPRPIPAGSESALVGALEPDRDGLVLGDGRRRALFLPSVWRQLADAARVRASSDRQGRPGNDGMARRTGGAALPGRIVRRSVAHGRCERDRDRDQSKRRRLCNEGTRRRFRSVWRSSPTDAS